MSSFDVLPNVIGVGSGRCGTTSLYQFLADHPSAFMPTAKELNYFGVKDSRIPVEEYLVNFAGASGASIRGEVSPVYLTLPGTAMSIAKAAPAAKIIIQLREPVSRAVSQFKHHHRRGKPVGSDNVEDFFQNFFARVPSKTKWFSPQAAVRQSTYSAAVAEYIRVFGEDRVLVLFYDDIGSQSYWDSICDFLEIERRPAGAALNGSRGDDRLSDGMRQRLKDLFRLDVEALEATLGRDLSHWK